MLTNLSTKKSFFDKQPYTGVIHPHFSHSGKKLLWSERIAEGGKWGEWALKVADFVVEEEEPRLENIRMYQPGEQHLFYESHGFSPDDKKIIFSGNLKMGQDENYLDIYTLDLETEELTRLTHSMSEWDEHAQFSPSGDKIVWMSSTRYGMNTERNWWKYLKTDYWMMNTDGSGKTQITFFNQNLGDSKRIICSDCSWNPDGTKLAVTMLVCDGEEATGGGIAIIEFF
ncbi:MAG TPA: hypothetical protein ENI45_03070 [Thermoplasmatales archaeon]|nr:hypothetical protein [Thermoplasmatales archaeon]